LAALALPAPAQAAPTLFFDVRAPAREPTPPVATRALERRPGDQAVAATASPAVNATRATVRRLAIRAPARQAANPRRVKRPPRHGHGHLSCSMKRPFGPPQSRAALATRAIPHRISAVASSPPRLVAMWLVGVTAFTTVLALQQRADARCEAQLVLFEIRSRVGELGQIAHSSQPGPAKRPLKLVEADLDAAERRIGAEVARLGRLDPDRGHAQIERHVDAFFAVIDRTLPFIAKGDDVNGSAIFAKSYEPGGPAFALTPALEARDARADGDRARLLAYVGSIVAMPVTLLAFSLMLQRAIQARRRAVQARERIENVDADVLARVGRRRRLPTWSTCASASLGRS
jgi:hypothetical protein